MAVPDPLWCCPQCFGALNAVPDRVRCDACAATYLVVAGIPDLRVVAPSWIDADADRDRAWQTDAIAREAGAAAALNHVFLKSRGMAAAAAAHRTRQVLAGVAKHRVQIDDWLARCFDAEPAVEIGCGPGQLLAAAATAGRSLAGVDVSLEWLVVAKHLVREAGGEAKLAAGLAERLPLRSASVHAILALDVIEHLGAPAAFVGEIARTLHNGGRFVLTTPNRFSLSPEPHVGVWGVGWLPRPLQARWVRLASGKSYDFTQLLSAAEARRLFRNTESLTPTIAFPPIADADLAMFTGSKARLARLYNAAMRLPLAQTAAPAFGAYFRIAGRKTGSS